MDTAAAARPMPSWTQIEKLISRSHNNVETVYFSD